MQCQFGAFIRDRLTDEDVPLTGIGARQCAEPPLRLVRSRILTDNVYRPACRRHMDYIASRDENAMTKPL